MWLMLPVHRVIGHKEYGNTPPGGWKGRKIDPVYDMNWRRDRVANFTPRGDDMPALTDDDIRRIWRYADPSAPDPTWAITRLQGIDAKVSDIPGAVWDRSMDDGTDPKGNGYRLGFRVGRTANLVEELSARLVGVEAALRALAEARGDVDVEALLAGVEEIVERNRAVLDVRVSPGDDTVDPA